MTTYINSLNEDVNEIQMFLEYNEVQYFAEAGSGLKNKIKKIIDWFKNVFNKVWNWIKDTVKKLVRSLKKTASKIKNFVTGVKTSEVYSLDATIKLKEYEYGDEFDKDPDAGTEKIKDWADESRKHIKEEIGKKSKEALSKENLEKAVQIGVDLETITNELFIVEKTMGLNKSVGSLQSTHTDKSDEEIEHIAKKAKEAASVLSTFGAEIAGILKVYVDFVAKIAVASK